MYKYTLRSRFITFIGHTKSQGNKKEVYTSNMYKPPPVIVWLDIQILTWLPIKECGLNTRSMIVM